MRGTFVPSKILSITPPEKILSIKLPVMMPLIAPPVKKYSTRKYTFEYDARKDTLGYTNMKKYSITPPEKNPRLSDKTKKNLFDDATKKVFPRKGHQLGYP